jgi:sulfopyruvate decarboxylase TPP-binding subunit
MIVGVSDKLLMPWLEGKKYLDCSNEGESIAIAAGYYLITGERATAFMSADGLCNALNFLTSWIIPEKIPLNLVISTGRQESPHKVMSDTLEDLLKLYGLPSETISVELVRKQ